MRRINLFLLFCIQFGNPPSYDFSRKSFIPNLSKSCLLPSYDNNITYFDYWGDPKSFNEEEWIDYNSDELELACFERIFICIGIVAILLGSIISIWTKLDPEFQNLHKPASNEKDYEMSSFASSSDPAINPLNEVSEDQLEKEQCSADTNSLVLVRI